jgi:hypothetical protein
MEDKPSFWENHRCLCHSEQSEESCSILWPWFPCDKRFFTSFRMTGGRVVSSSDTLLRVGRSRATTGVKACSEVITR